ncbi:SCP2 sterol-binding domain-containing protein [Bacillus sp. ISL-75]|uniref:SCP2 sterol-binding domain-containing protein n=1 Tax=Bacillus sp. ISL-75 TaxID=2819137 RepID=UPI001BE72C46|nr:SCP2 sterol-binding domain-containing protein [Bacillus sp. ISL-75]MBT2729127.1 SCP2 sterol-binding domain-containing protein [Bacillus sp. ISL-75]
MIEMLKNFQLAIKQQRHVLPLLEQIDLRVNLVCEQKAIQIIIKNGEIFILHDSEVTRTISEIRGDLKAMKQLLEGKERLRALEHNGQLRISAPIRTTLLLESVFYLTKAQENLPKITNF